jgi:hypothetical protein
MPRKEEEETTRVHVHLFQRDVDRLDDLFGATMGRASAIRKIIRAFINNVEAKASERSQPVTPTFTLPGDDNNGEPA